ncbi:4883_t:CDS:2, partial [Gigaspora rosea]
MSLDKNTFQVNLENMDIETSAENQEPHFEEQEQHSEENKNSTLKKNKNSTLKKNNGPPNNKELDILYILCGTTLTGLKTRKNYDRILQSTLLIQNVKLDGSCDEKKLILALDLCFKIPIRQTISDHVLRIYEQERAQLCNFFQNFDRKVAMIVNAWSACTNQAYLSITLHWINDDWYMQRILLDLIPLHERHTGVFIAENIIEQVEYFGLGAQLLFLTADNATNMDVCGCHLANLLQSRYNNTNFCCVRCTSHILYLAVKEGISVLDRSVKKAHEFTSYIRHSQPCFEELKKVFIMKNKQFLMPDLDVNMKWNSTYIMFNKLCRIQEMTNILVVSLSNLRPLYLTDDDWEKISVTTKLLSSSSHPTLGDLRTVFYVIMEILDDAQIELDSVKGSIAKKISNKIDHYWDELQLYFYEVVLLDPSTKFMPFESDTQNMMHCSKS